jgi:hypothetical protein
MPVGIERERRAVVSHLRTDILRMLPGHDQQTPEGVTEVMEADPRYLSLLDRRVERPGQHGWRHRTPAFAGEDERTSRRDLQCQQSFAHGRRHVDRPNAALRLCESEAPRPVIVRACDFDLVRREVRAILILPGHGLELAKPEAREDGRKE